MQNRHAACLHLAMYCTLIVRMRHDARQSAHLLGAQCEVLGAQCCTQVSNDQWHTPDM